MYESIEKSIGIPAKRELEPLSLERIKLEASYNQLRYGIGRHDDAIYALNEAIPRGHNPLEHFDKSAQPVDDLSESGKEHAQQTANEFFDRFDPNKDEIAFLSSAITRARETAAIYLQVAKERGFIVKVITSNDKSGAINLVDIDEYQEPDKRVVQRGKIPDELFEKHGGHEIRTLTSLSLDNIKQMFVEFIFHPQNYLDEVQLEHIDKIPQAYQDLWKEARKIIESDNKGGWGPNFLAHSERMQDIFDRYRTQHNLDESVIPHFASVKDMYEKNFRNILRLMARYDDAIDAYEAKSSSHKKVRVLGFSHENQLLYFLNKEFGRVGADKGKVIGFKLLKDKNGEKHFTACLSDATDQPKEIEFPNSSRITHLK